MTINEFLEGDNFVILPELKKLGIDAEVITEYTAVCNDTDVHMTTHIASTKYPEYWVCNAFIQYVWVDSKEVNTTYASELSQLVGMLLGLNVVIN